MPEPACGQDEFRARHLVSRREQFVVALVVFAVMSAVLLASRPISFWRPHVVSVAALEPGAGYEIVVPQDARDGVILIRRHGLAKFDIGKGVVAAPAIYQRLVGSAYPARLQAGSPHHIEFADRLDTAHCTPVATLGKMVYARCKR